MDQNSKVGGQEKKNNQLKDAKMFHIAEGNIKVT